MAVRHGYGKVAGTDALVFAYDTGDTKNSYPGEPTTNINPTGVAFGHNSGNYENEVEVTDAPEKGPGWKKVVIKNRGNNFRIIQWTYTSMAADTMYCHSAVFDWGNMRDKGYYIIFDGTGTGTRAYYRPGDYTNTGSTSINATMPDGKFMATITHTASHSHAFFIRNSTTGVSSLNDYFYYKELQVEVNSHPTPYTTGTRSVSGSLLDLTGLSVLNLSNVSFDSNAQIDFDGTDDRIQIADSSAVSVTGAEITLEVIVRKDTNGSMVPIHKDYQYSIRINSDNSITYADSSVWSYSNFGNHSTGNTNGSYAHIVATKSNGIVTLYSNGEVVVSKSFGGNITHASNDLFIGAYSGTSSYMNGAIPIAKIYNRALTADEVRNNHRHYKNRFNI